MRLSTRLYLLLLAATGAGRLLELRVSRRRLRALAQHGVTPLPEPAFRWIVVLHTGVLAGSALEAVLLHRRCRWPLAGAALLAALLANGLRWWAIASLGPHWNVRIADSSGLGVVTRGPYRWIRHPNYLALIVEMEALPLIHSAWLTALAGGAAHALLLRQRIAAEEAVLLRNPAYRAAMGAKPRLLPRIRRRSMVRPPGGRNTSGSAGVPPVPADGCHSRSPRARSNSGRNGPILLSPFPCGGRGDESPGVHGQGYLGDAAASRLPLPSRGRIVASN